MYRGRQVPDGKNWHRQVSAASMPSHSSDSYPAGLEVKQGFADLGLTRTCTRDAFGAGSVNAAAARSRSHRCVDDSTCHGSPRPLADSCPAVLTIATRSARE